LYLTVEDVGEKGDDTEWMFLTAGFHRVGAEDLLDLRGRHILRRLLLRPPHNVPGGPPTLVVLRLYKKVEGYGTGSKNTARYGTGTCFQVGTVRYLGNS